MKTPNFNQSLFTTLIFSLFFTACIKLDTDLKTKLDIHTLTIPPKLAVSATLDGESGHFSIFLSEGRALAGYVSYANEIIIRDGEIRLFEDDKLIMSEPGPIDMSYIAPNLQDENGNPIEPHFWYRFEKYGISTRPGNVYRLEVEVDGYETVTSSMTMPAAPVVAASMDTTVMVIKNWTRSQDTGGGVSSFDNRHYYLSDEVWEGGFWPLSVHLTAPEPNAQNYFALNLFGVQSSVNDNSGNVKDAERPLSLGVSDISVLEGNPDLEAQTGGLLDTDYADFYLFGYLPFLMNDNTFSGKTASFTFHSWAEVTCTRKLNINPNPNVPGPGPDQYELVYVKRSINLRVKHLPESTFKYYRSQALQRQRVGFFTEPVNVTGNIKNGYGYFSVYNSVSINLLEYELGTWVYRPNR